MAGNITPGSAMAAHGKPREAFIEAVITRSDGTREDLGVVAYWHRNPLRRLWWRLTHRR